MATRAKRGTAKDVIGIFVQLSPELHQRFEAAVASRDITKRRLVEAAILQELEHPTAVNEQGGLYDVA